MKYFLLMMLAANALVAQTRTIPAEIEIDFTVTEFGLSKVEGGFQSDGISAEATFEGDMLMAFEGCVVANSFATGVAARDRNVVNKEEFLDAEKYPTICFTADKIEFVGKIGSKTTYDMRGDLTLRGETHPIEVRVVQTDAKSLEASFSIDRTQWSVGTGPAALFVSDNVDLVANINLN
ncbi:MAG: YceI family protein [Schleiferiaceae bacterium]|jgi:polyisoprenoid-binding protein YceI